MKPSSIVTLLTDFGLDDPYVGVMKGAMLARFPDARLVDLTHAIPPQHVEAAGFWLERSYRWFPPGTVHLVVVDPGVGSARDAVVLPFQDHLFVGPHNGVFERLLALAPSTTAYRIDAAHLGFTALSATFHGRDLFGPVAASLASGQLDPRAVGPSITVRGGAGFGVLGVGGDRVEGRVVVIDHFGNLISNIQATDLPRDRTLRVSIAGRAVPLIRTYADVAPGECAALFGSFGTLEVSARDAHAALLLGAESGAPIVIEVA